MDGAAVAEGAAKKSPPQQSQDGKDTDSNNKNDDSGAPGASTTTQDLPRAESIGLGRLPSFDLDNLLDANNASNATGSFTIGGGSASASLDMGVSLGMGSTDISLSVPEPGNLLKALPSLPSQTNIGLSSAMSHGGSGSGGSHNKHVHFSIGDLAPTPSQQDLFNAAALHPPPPSVAVADPAAVVAAAAAGATVPLHGTTGGGILRAPSLDLNILQKLESQPSFEKLKSQPSLLRMGSFGLNSLTKMPSLGRMPSLVRMGSLTRMGSIGNALQSAKSGDFLEFLNEITAQQLQAAQAEQEEDLMYDSLPPTPTTPLTPMDTPAHSPIFRGGQASLSPEPREEDLSAEGTVNNPENDLFAVNEAVFREAVETTKTNNVKLKTYFLSDERARDMLFFPKDRLPWFEISRDGRGRRLETEGAPHQQQQQAGQPKRSRTVTHVSDKQVQCICSLRPQLMFPEGTSGWRFQDMGGPVCQAVRNTTGAKKELENYKYTGFCKDHVEGKGAGSRQTWEKHDKTSVRGFNLERNVNDRRMRHILCLETNSGLVFLKWCTQCHLWKNFAGFTERAMGDNDLLVHTFCKVCHQRQVLSRDKRRMERAKKRKAAEMSGAGAGANAGGGAKAKHKVDKDLEDLAEKIHLKRQNTMDRAWVKSFALESTLSKFNKFSKTIFENIEEKPIICGVFSGTAEDIIVLRAMDIMVELQTNPRQAPQTVFGEGRWTKVAQEIMENDLEPALGSNQYAEGAAGGGGLQRQTSLELWAKPEKRENVRRTLQRMIIEDEDVRYKVILLGALLVEARLTALLSPTEGEDAQEGPKREVKLEAMYEGCILMAFTCDLLPHEEKSKTLELTPDQMFGLHKMGWGALHYKCGAGKVLQLVEGPRTHADPLVEIVEMVGVKMPPRQEVEGIATIYPPGGEDWQGCNHLHYAVLTSTLADLLPGQMPATEVMEKQNRRGFSPIEVAALCNPHALPALLTHLAGQRGDKEGRAKFLRKLLKTLESCMMQHVKHDLLKRNASHATTIVTKFM